MCAARQNAWLHHFGHDDSHKNSAGEVARRIEVGHTTSAAATTVTATMQKCQINAIKAKCYAMPFCVVLESAFSSYKLYIFSTFSASDNLFSRGVAPVDFSTLASFQRCHAPKKMEGGGSSGRVDGVCVCVCAYVQTPNMQLTRCHSSSGSLVANSTKLHRVKHFIIQSECCSMFIHTCHPWISRNCFSTWDLFILPLFANLSHWIANVLFCCVVAAKKVKELGNLSRSSRRQESVTSTNCCPSV